MLCIFEAYFQAIAKGEQRIIMLISIVHQQCKSTSRQYSLEFVVDKNHAFYTKDFGAQKPCRHKGIYIYLMYCSTRSGLLAWRIRVLVLPTPEAHFQAVAKGEQGIIMFITNIHWQLVHIPEPRSW